MVSSAAEATILDTYASSNLRRHTTTNPLYRWHMEAFHDRIFAFVQQADPDSILDAGCGEGFGVHDLAERDASLDLTGIDLDEDAVAYAEARFGEVASFDQGSILDLPYGDDTRDLVLCSEVLEHLADPGAAIAELKRVARTHVLITVPLEPYFQALNDVAQWLGISGDPGHVQFWGHTAFRAFVEAHFDRAAFARKHMYQMALCPV
jgi:2-polyprenyl-3-methyl-5-hydroxy-6-metoxy-1,4-benzoquinol methylase